MARDVKVFDVFIASPGGLGEERRLFRELIQSYNESEAIHSGVQFRPVGWEDTLEGQGRPQELINEDLKGCDYFVMLLWDRWGTPSSKDGRYSSGTEEEFELAKACLKDPNQPMRKMVVFFRDVDPKQLKDPGDQLKKVLAFKDRIEREKDFLFGSYPESPEFRERLRNHLGRWRREHEEERSRSAASQTKLEEFLLPSLSATVPAEVSPLGQTDQQNRSYEFWFKEGSVSLSESDYPSAQVFFRKAVVASTAPADKATSLERLGTVLALIGRWEEALTHYDAAVAELQSSDEPDVWEIAWALVNKGITLGALNRSEEEIAVYDEVVRRFGEAEEPALREIVNLANQGLAKVNPS